MTGLETVVSELLLRIYPEPFLWAFILLLIVFLGLKFSKATASESAFLAMISIYTINSVLHGFFDILNMIGMAVIGIMFVFAFFKMGSR